MGGAGSVVQRRALRRPDWDAAPRVMHFRPVYFTVRSFLGETSSSSVCRLISVRLFFCCVFLVLQTWGELPGRGGGGIPCLGKSESTNSGATKPMPLLKDERTNHAGCRKSAKARPNVYPCKSLKTPDKLRTKISHRIHDTEILPRIPPPRGKANMEHKHRIHQFAVCVVGHGCPTFCDHVSMSDPSPPNPIPRRVTFRRVAPFRGPGQSPVLPFACCIGSLRSVGRCGRCSCWCRFRVREPRRWCAGAVLDVAGCAVCASAAPNNWRIEVVLVVVGLV